MILICSHKPEDGSTLRNYNIKRLLLVFVSDKNNNIQNTLKGAIMSTFTFDTLNTFC